MHPEEVLARQSSGQHEVHDVSGRKGGLRLRPCHSQSTWHLMSNEQRPSKCREYLVSFLHNQIEYISRCHDLVVGNDFPDRNDREYTRALFHFVMQQDPPIASVHFPQYVFLEVLFHRLNDSCGNTSCPDLISPGRVSI